MGGPSRKQQKTREPPLRRRLSFRCGGRHVTSPAANIRDVTTDGTDDAITEAAGLLRAGRLVAFPTETVYGLGADATDDGAVAAIFAAKDRPAFNPLIVHFADAGGAARAVAFDERARQLASAFWPGALTLVLPRRRQCAISLLVSAGLDSVAVRVPDHAVARALLDAAGCPIAAPSANRAGRLSPSRAGHVAEELGGAVDLILDGGPCRLGVESTIVGLSGETAVLLRPGGIAVEVIESLIGPLAAPGGDPARPQSPGMGERHYAPGRPLKVNAPGAEDGEALLGFGPGAPQGAMNLSPNGDVAEAAANLFAMIRALDRPDVTAIAVMPIPQAGLGRAINDRLRRAAAGNPAGKNDGGG